MVNGIALGRLLLGVGCLSFCGTAFAARWQVEVTNVTPGQSFTPILAVSHYPPTHLFALGEPASPGLAALAEGGDTAPLAAEVEALRGVGPVQTIGGLLGPGETRRFEVEGRIGQNLSLAAMLIPTNDTFFAVDAVLLPIVGRVAIHALGYDAGSEPNDQNCANIPGPRCGGAGTSPNPDPGDEGFVHVGNGFHDLGDAPQVLKPAHYDWNNPVAVITIRRTH
jgi:hypothetical protein